MASREEVRAFGAYLADTEIAEFAPEEQKALKKYGAKLRDAADDPEISDAKVQAIFAGIKSLYTQISKRVKAEGAEAAEGEEGEEGSEDHEATVSMVASALSHLANDLNPPYTADRIAAVMPTVDVVAQAVLSSPETLARFTSPNAGDADAVSGIIDFYSMASEDSAQLRAASWPGLAARVRATYDAVRTLPGAHAETESVADILDDAASASEEGEFRGLLREAVNKLWNAVSTIAPTVGASIPTASMPPNATRKPEMAAQVEGPVPPNRANPNQPVAPPSTGSTGWILWAPVGPGGESVPLGAGGKPQGSYGWEPLADKAAARQIAGMLIKSARQEGDALGGDPKSYSVEPFVPQAAPEVEEDAEEGTFPSTEALTSVLDQFLVGMYEIDDSFDVDAAGELSEAVSEMVAYLDGEYGQHDWTDPLIEAAETRRRNAAQNSGGERADYWTTAQKGDLTRTIRTGETVTVDGKVYAKVTVPLAEAAKQLGLWSTGLTYTDADFGPLRAADSARGTEPAPKPPTDDPGVFSLIDGHAFVDSVALGRAASAEGYAIVVTPTGAREIAVLGDEDSNPLNTPTMLCARLSSEQAALPGGVGDVYEITQHNPKPAEGDLPGIAVYAFLKDLELRGYAVALAGTSLSGAIEQAAEKNGGLTVAELCVALQGALPAYEKTAAEGFAVPAVHLFLTTTSDLVELSILYAPQNEGDPDPFAIRLSFDPIEDEVWVNGTLDLKGAEEVDLTLSLADALNPATVLNRLVQAYIAIRPEQFGSATRASTELEGAKTVARESVFRTQIIKSAENWMKHTHEDGVRGLPINGGIE
jgi:hypothetical protein